MYEEHTRWHVWWRRNETAGRIVIFMKKKKKEKTERTNCTTVGICVHENAEEQSETRYFRESRHVCK